MCELNRGGTGWDVCTSLKNLGQTAAAAAGGRPSAKLCIAAACLASPPPLSQLYITSTHFLQPALYNLFCWNRPTLWFLFSCASSSTLYPCRLIGRWSEFRTSVASRLCLMFGGYVNLWWSCLSWERHYPIHFIQVLSFLLEKKLQLFGTQIFMTLLESHLEQLRTNPTGKWGIRAIK